MNNVKVTSNVKDDYDYVVNVKRYIVDILNDDDYENKLTNLED